MIDGQTILDYAITLMVLIGLFLLAYSGMRHQGLGDTLREVRDFFREKIEDKQEELRYV